MVRLDDIAEWLQQNGYEEASKAIDCAFSDEIDQEVGEEAQLIKGLGVMVLNGTKYVPMHQVVTFIRRLEKLSRKKILSVVVPDKYRLSEDEFDEVWNALVDDHTDSNIINTGQGYVVYLESDTHAKLKRVLNWYWDREFYALEREVERVDDQLDKEFWKETEANEDDN